MTGLPVLGTHLRTAILVPWVVALAAMAAAFACAPASASSTATIEITVQVAPPTVTSITPNSGLDSGSVDITNLSGTGFMSKAKVKLTKTGQTDLSATSVAVLSSTKITCAFDLTGAATGQWNVVVTNPDTQSGTLPNGFTVNNPAPTVTSITQDSGQNNAMVDITNLAGTGFLAGATVKLTKSGKTDIAGTSVTVVSATKITCTFNLTGAVSGKWDVVVTNTDGQSGKLSDSGNWFTILASVTLTAPVGGETLHGGHPYSIAWTSTVPIDHVALFLSTDSGINYPQQNMITSSAPNTGSYAWTVPLINTTTARVFLRAFDAIGKVVGENASPADFTISSAVILTAPVGGETLHGGHPYSIAWTSTVPIDHVALFLSTDSGNNYPRENIITLSAPNTGSYAWTVPLINTTRARVFLRAFDAMGTVVGEDASPADFTINSAVILTAPVGGETLQGGSQYSITWTSTVPIGRVALFLSTDSGKNYPQQNMITASVPRSGSYAWTVPVINTTRARVLIRAFDTNNNVIADDASPADFTITSAVTLTAPKDGETVEGGSQYSITWTGPVPIDHVALFLSTDSGKNYPQQNIITASAPNSGGYTWTVPLINTSTARVFLRAFDASNNIVGEDWNHADFTIASRSVTLTAPKDGETVVGGSQYSITWTSTVPIDHVALFLSTNSGNSFPGQNVITSSASATNSVSYTWRVPLINITTARVFLRAFDASDNVVGEDENHADFTIASHPVTLTAPKDGAAVQAGSQYSITWTGTVPIDHVALFLSTNSGNDYPRQNIITSSTPNTGSYTWTVPLINTTTARVFLRAFDATNNVVGEDQNQADFTITQTTRGIADDVALTLFVASPDPVSRGKSLTFSIKLKNLSTQTVTGAKFAITDANGIKLIADLSLPTWKPGEELTGTVRLPVSRNTPAGDHFITGEVLLPEDKNPSNNRQTVKVTVK